MMKMMKLIYLFLMPSHQHPPGFSRGRERKGDVDLDLGFRVTAAAGCIFFWQPNIFPGPEGDFPGPGREFRGVGSGIV